MQDIQLIIKLLVDYGIMLIIVSLFLYVAIRIININLKRYEKFKGDKTHDELLDMRADIGKSIQELIDTCLAETKANRLLVIEFSNSVMSVAYLPFRYMTCTYEVFKLGKTATGHKIDRISTSLFTPFFEALANNDYCTFDIHDKTTLVGGAMCDLMESQHEHQALCVLLKSNKGKSIGYIQLTKDDAFTRSDISKMKDLGEKVSTLLSVLDK